MLIRRPISERVRLADLLRPARRRVAETVCEAFLLRHPDWITRHGDRARHYTIEDAVYHQDFLAAAIESGETSAFTDYLRWTAGVLEARGIGAADIVCKEKMCPVLSAFSYLTMDEAIEIATANLMLEGAGHSAAMHSNNQENIAKAGSRLPVSRLIINAPCATTAGGTVEGGLAFTNTLGCGSWGNNSISENLSYYHLFNKSRIAYVKPNWNQPSDEEIFK